MWDPDREANTTAGPIEDPDIATVAFGDQATEIEPEPAVRRRVRRCRRSVFLEQVVANGRRDLGAVVADLQHGRITFDAARDLDRTAGANVAQRVVDHVLHGPPD